MSQHAASHRHHRHDQNHLHPHQDAIERAFAEITTVHIFSLNQTRLSRRDKLALYALYKQATEGDARLSLLARFNAKKYAWSSMKGSSAALAKLKYVELYQRLQQQALQGALRSAKLEGHDTPQRRAWLLQAHRPQALEPLVEPGFTSVYLDQLLPALLAQYYANTKAKYLQAAHGKTRSDLYAMRPHSPLKNADMARLFGDFNYSQFLHALPDLAYDARCHYLTLFGLAENEAENRFVADLSTVHALPVRESDHTSLVSTVLLFEMAPGLRLLAIACKNLPAHDAPGVADAAALPQFPATLHGMQVLYPHDGLAWELAKLHAALNARYSTITGVHVQVHFALSSPIGIVAEALLPDDAPALAQGVLARLLKAHSFLQTAVDAHAFHSEDSILHAANLPYSTWCIQVDRGAGIMPFIRLITDGWPGHPIYRGADSVIDMAAHYEIGQYRKILWRIKAVIDQFVAGVCQQIAGDAQEQAFARDFLARLIPVLPQNSPYRQADLNDATAMALLQTLLARHILNTIQHSIDHGLQEDPLCDKMPMIMRCPIDFTRREQDLALIMQEVAQINTLTDRSRAQMAANVFFHSHISRSLPDFFAHGGYFPADHLGYLPKMSPGPHTDALRLLQAQFAKRLFELLHDDECPVDASKIGVSIQS